MNRFGLTGSRKAGLRRLDELGRTRVNAFFGAVTELFGSELAELSAEEWLRELEATDDLPTSASEWRRVTAKVCHSSQIERTIMSFN